MKSRKYAALIGFMCFLIPVVHGDYVKIFGVYHAIGYDEPGTVLAYGQWLEFHKIERWNRQCERWEKVDYVY